ncbi:MAG: family 43 glycosylhydrolase [Bacteroidota bacterium]|nr:family 43 glycosylhydrolase [Bacteroidota bacterium]
MKKSILFLSFITFACFAKAQIGVRYNPDIQPTTVMQYFKPVGNNLFVGDCIPFYRKGTYYLYWLLDSAHHSAMHGLGGHQWALSTTTDLKHWKNYPIVLGIDEEWWEKSICTGSVVYSNNKFYAFYATRLINKEGKINEQLSYAISNDGIHFEKQKPNPFYTSAPGYSQRNFRDPKVVVDKDGTFHLFVASNKDSSSIKGLDGVLVHLTSNNLKDWKVNQPLITGEPTTPECPDYFLWNGWYYIVYSDASNTFYLKSRQPYGPWEQPQSQALDEDWANVVKTAEFTNNRRIAAAWIPSRKDNKDDGHEMFGGNTVFRELIQDKDGTLNTKFPKEMIPLAGSPISLNPVLDASSKADKDGYLINAPDGIGTVHFENIPDNCRITLEIQPVTSSENYGLYLHSNEDASGGYRLLFSPNDRTVSLGNTSISAVDGLNKTIKVDIILKDDIIDVCIDNRKCIVNRTPEMKGNFLWLFAKHGQVKFQSVKVAKLLENQ